MHLTNVHVHVEIKYLHTHMASKLDVLGILIHKLRGVQTAYSDNEKLIHNA